jgi:hypothetical protein
LGTKLLKKIEIARCLFFGTMNTGVLLYVTLPCEEWLNTMPLDEIYGGITSLTQMLVLYDLG